MTDEIRLRVVFYKTEAGKEPVRDGFIKKSQKTPAYDLGLAKKRMQTLME